MHSFSTLPIGVRGDTMKVRAMADLLAGSITNRKIMLMTTPRPYTHQELSLIWSKAVIVPGTNPAVRRKDLCGAWIDWAAYGNRQSAFGWEVDHAVALANGGAHHINNVRPLHWQNNARKSDGSLVCAITARG